MVLSIRVISDSAAVLNLAVESTAHGCYFLQRVCKREATAFLC